MSKRRSQLKYPNRFNPESIERDLHRQQSGTAPRDIIARHARLQANGKPVRCTPSRAAVASDDPLGLDSYKKVVFDTAEKARECAAELATVLDPSVVARYVYPCRRSRTGHVHLTSKRPPDHHDESEVEV